MQREKSGGSDERQGLEEKEVSQGTAKIWLERVHHDIEVKMAEFKEGMPVCK